MEAVCGGFRRLWLVMGSTPVGTSGVLWLHAGRHAEAMWQRSSYRMTAGVAPGRGRGEVPWTSLSLPHLLAKSFAGSSTDLRLVMTSDSKEFVIPSFEAFGELAFGRPRRYALVGKQQKQEK